MREVQRRRFESLAEKPLLLGRVGEHLVTEIQIAVSDAKEVYLVVERPNGTTFQRRWVTNDGQIVWLVKQSEIGQHAGDGKAQVILYRPTGEIEKSAIARTEVKTALPFERVQGDVFVVGQSMLGKVRLE